MAVTGAIFNSLTFGGVNSADYGIYITGEAVFNAPERAVEMVEVPGRNGAIALDQGRWENVEVQYTAGTFGMNEEEFRTALSDFRNAIVSQLGYQRLTDTYHPDEYRMALYVSGLDVSPKYYNSAGEFNLTFNCKPQRWLANGDAAITVASGDTLYNPTQYDAGPLLMIEGYGTIGFNGFEIDIDEGYFGETQLVAAGPGKFPSSQTSLKTNLFNDGDTIRIPAFSVTYKSMPKDATTKVTVRSISGDIPFTYRERVNGLIITGSFSEISFDSSADYINSAVCQLSFTTDGTLVSCQLTIRIRYIVASHTIQISMSSNITSQTSRMNKFGLSDREWNGIYVDSTKSYLGHPTYLDCELGEAYKIENETYVALNRFIAFGSDLPILKSGANEITIDSTITELKVKPNWWKL